MRIRVSAVNSILNLPFFRCKDMSHVIWPLFDLTCQITTSFLIRQNGEKVETSKTNIFAKVPSIEFYSLGGNYGTKIVTSQLRNT